MCLCFSIASAVLCHPVPSKEQERFRARGAAAEEPNVPLSAQSIT